MRKALDKFLAEDVQRKKLLAHIESSIKQAGAPEVGIFWVYKGQLLAMGVPLSGAQDYGEYRTYPVGHDKMWRDYQRIGVVPRGIPYEEAPRGRVGYNAKTKKFTILADMCIKDDAAMISKIKKEFNLPKTTPVKSDDHYLCQKCSRGPKEDEDDW